MTGRFARNYPRTSQEWLDDNQARLAQLRKVADRARSAVESTTGRSRSENGAIEVAVDSSGELISLVIADSALKLGAAHLADAILETARDARRSGIELVGTALADLQTEQAGTEVLEALGLNITSPPSEKPIDTPVIDDDDWFQASVLHRA